MRLKSEGASSGDESNEDEKPEVMSTKQAHNPPASDKKAAQTKHCKYFSTGGNCGKRGKCRFVHDPAVREAALKERERNGGRMTLQQRLILNDKEQEDLTIVRTLKYLQDRGLMIGGKENDDDAPPGVFGASDAAGTTAGALTEPDMESKSTPVSNSTLPPTPIKTNTHGLPPIPPPSVNANNLSASKYAGWNLSGFH